MTTNERRIFQAFEDRREREASEGGDLWGNCSECNAVGHLYGSDEDALLCEKCDDAAGEEE